jgi:hypothetical protein
MFPPEGRVATPAVAVPLIVARQRRFAASDLLVPMGYRRSGVRPVPLLDGLSPQMGGTVTEARTPAMAQTDQTAGEEPQPASAADRPTRADALRRIAAEVSGRHDLDGLFRDVIDEAFTLFSVDQAGLFMYDDTPAPLRVVAQRGGSGS